jgi:hypothetical protein
MSAADRCYHRIVKGCKKEINKGETLKRKGTTKNPTVEVEVLEPGIHPCAFCRIQVYHTNSMKVNANIGWVCEVCRKYPNHIRDGSTVRVPTFFGLIKDTVPSVYHPCKNCSTFYQVKYHGHEYCTTSCETAHREQKERYYSRSLITPSSSFSARRGIN